MKNLIGLACITWYVFSSMIFSQSIEQSPLSGVEHIILPSNNEQHPCITEEEYASALKRCNQNASALNLNEHSTTHIAATSFQWPLRASATLQDYSYYLITNYVDDDTVKGSIKDYSCGKTTYDAHHGTDIVLWPFTMYKMDNNQVEVIAAAPGIIIDKKDGFFDKNCVTNSGGTNYVIVQHADGSRAYYWHLKKNSLTAKAIGQSVALGEFLAIVGSSGSSSIPHLHFEVLTGGAKPTLIDPYAGSCNSFNASSWWNVQKPYVEPAIVKLSLHSVKPVFPACPATETLNEKFSFPSSTYGEALFYSFTRSESLGMAANYRIVNPDGSTFSSWSSTSTTNYNATIRYWLKTLPTEPGTYLFEGTMNTITTSTPFQITGVTSVATQSPVSVLRVYPNPTQGNITFDWGNESGVEHHASIEVYNILGVKVHQFETVSARTELNLQLPTGIYFMQMKKEHTTVPLGKFILYSHYR